MQKSQIAIASDLKSLSPNRRNLSNVENLDGDNDRRGVNRLWEPPRLPIPQNTPNSDHRLSLPFPETQTMVWVSPFPNKYRVWGGLGFGPSFPGPWSEFLPWCQKHWGRGRRVSLDWDESEISRRSEYCCPLNFWEVMRWRWDLRCSLRMLWALWYWFLLSWAKWGHVIADRWQNSPPPNKSGKEVSESKKPHFPPPQKRVFRVKKSPFSL